MARVRANFVDGTLDVGIDNDDTTLVSGGLADLPAVSGGDRAVIVLDPEGTAGPPEIVLVTAHTAATDTATVLRGQEGTSARSHLADTEWEHSPTAIDAGPSSDATKGATLAANQQLTASFADLTGVSFTLDRLGLWMVIATARFAIPAGHSLESQLATSGGTASIDNAVGTFELVNAADSSRQSTGSTVHFVTVTALTPTVKLQARVSTGTPGAGDLAVQDFTRMSAVWLGA